MTATEMWTAIQEAAARLAGVPGATISLAMATEETVVGLARVSGIEARRLHYVTDKGARVIVAWESSLSGIPVHAQTGYVLPQPGEDLTRCWDSERGMVDLSGEVRQ